MRVVFTAFELLAWDDIIELEAKRSQLARLGRAVLSYTDLIVTGTIFRCPSANLRDFGFSIQPVRQVLLFSGLALSFALALRYRIEMPRLRRSRWHRQRALGSSSCCCGG
jgi:hypothetical protein